MAKKTQKIIAALKKIAEEIDNISLNDPEAWQNISAELATALKSLPKKKSATLALLEQVGQAFDALGAQSVKEPLALTDAIWQALNAAELSLVDDEIDDEPLNEFRQKLADILGPDEIGDGDEPVEEPPMNIQPAIESLDDAAAFLIQLDPDNTAELQSLRDSLKVLSGGDDIVENVRIYIDKVVEKLDQLLDGQYDDSDQAISEIGELLEEAMSPIEMQSMPDEGADKAEAADENTADAIDKDTDHMPQDVDEELLSEFIAEGSDLIEKAEEALLSLETNPEDMDSIGMVFRAFHTVKGTSAFLELALIAELGHHAESLLSRVRDGEIRYSGGYADLSLRALDMIKELMEGVQAALTGEPLLKPGGYDELVKVLSDPESAGISDEAGDMDAPRVGDVLWPRGKSIATRLRRPPRPIRMKSWVWRWSNPRPHRSRMWVRRCGLKIALKAAKR